MVTQNGNPKESRPPTLEDLVSLCRALNTRKAKYIVIGGMAVIQHGFVRATEDIDLLVETSRENEKAVIAALSQLPDAAARELKPGDIDEFEVIRIADEIVVDVMKSACGVDFAQASKSVLKVKLQGVEIPFADAALMIRLKQGVRSKDQLDLGFFMSLSQKKH
ncbi:MAG: hypothetical protein HYR96_11280 [Deltaproteobacteria bacterium]|nr:hypothetical protein [Deltaproteobacteria bacterium]MBI3293287.1 hypothetical protein [Deltaproteobacteria bacterium]